MNAYQKFLRNKKGGISLFLCGILTATILVESIYYFRAWYGNAQSDLYRSMSLQINANLSHYNEKLYSMYGLYAMNSTDGPHDVFERSFAHSGIADLKSESSALMSGEDVFRGGVDYAKIRFPATAVDTVLHWMKDASDTVGGGNTADQIMSGQNGAGKYISDIMSGKEDIAALLEKAKEYIEIVDITNSMSSLTGFLDQWSSVKKQTESLRLQGNDQAPEIFQKGFDPTSISHILQVVDSVISVDLPDVLDTLLFHEYLLATMDSQLSNGESGEGYVEKNHLGEAFSGYHAENAADLEYIFTGIDQPFLAKTASNAVIFSLRFLVNYAEILMDDQDMMVARSIATLLDAVVTAASFGMVHLGAEAWKYVVITVWALGSSVKDLMQLLDGKSFPFFQYDSMDKTLEKVLTMGYRDYFRILYLMTPTAWMQDRALTVMQRDCGENLPIALAVEVDFLGASYREERGYILYEG